MTAEGKEELLIYTIGHSTRSQRDLIDLLEHYGVRTLIDIRSTPYSRYNPQFNRETMAEAMPESGIRYEHVGRLGGRRPPKEVLDRAKSCSERSRGFAAYMQTEEFQEGIEEVLAMAREGQVALMCAESNPSHCHRFWVADALVERGIAVRHIVDASGAEPHPANLFTYM